MVACVVVFFNVCDVCSFYCLATDLVYLLVIWLFVVFLFVVVLVVCGRLSCLGVAGGWLLVLLVGLVWV